MIFGSLRSGNLQGSRQTSNIFHVSVLVELVDAFQVEVGQRGAVLLGSLLLIAGLEILVLFLEQRG